MRMIRVGLIFMAALPLAAGCSRKTAGTARADLRLDLVSPITIRQVQQVQDGGSVVIVLQDAQGRECQMTLDGRFGSPTRGRMYLLGPHPPVKGSQVVSAGSPLEMEIIQALRGALQAAGYNEAEQSALRKKSAVSPDDPDAPAWAILRAITVLQERSGS